ncbi:MAG TPA: hypothetical protein PLP19_13050 [bacterium]|nr:hypothetical protein [bacterium]HPN44413.1 hypothetical protein [bacterium]
MFKRSCSLVNKFIITLGLILVAGCSQDSNPLKAKETDHDHAEAAGFQILNGSDLVVKYEQGVVTGALTLQANQTSPVYNILFIAEDGDLFTPAGDAHTFAWEIANTTIAAMIYAAADGKWQFKLQGVSTGVTTITFKINHNDHADFVGLPVTINVANTVPGNY